MKVVTLNMTDQDVIERAAKFLQARVYFLKGRKSNYKPVYGCRVYGDSAVAAMKALLPLMGKRRAQKIQELLAKAARRLSPWERSNKGTRMQARNRRDTRTLSLEF